MKFTELNLEESVLDALDAMRMYSGAGTDHPCHFRR